MSRGTKSKAVSKGKGSSFQDESGSGDIKVAGPTDRSEKQNKKFQEMEQGLLRFQDHKSNRRLDRLQL